MGLLSVMSRSARTARIEMDDKVTYVYHCDVAVRKDRED